MRRTKTNAASHTALRRAIFALAFLSLLNSLVLPMPFTNASARDGRAANSTAVEHAAAPARAQDTAAAQAQAREAYGKVSLTFEANEGQTDPRVNFLTRAGGATVFLTPTEAVFALAVPNTGAGAATASKTLDPRARAAAAAPQQTAVLRMQIAGANAQAAVKGLEKQEGIVNYFVGSDPEKWHTNIPTYGRVEYAGVYPGVGLVYYGDGGRLEYDFVVEPGADASQVALKFEGADDLQLGANGDLLIKTAAGEVRQQKPVVYQESDGVRQEVESGYVLKGGGAVGFSLGAYDASKKLIIDPVLAYSTYLGGSRDDVGNAIAVDSAGDAYVAGTTSSFNFPVTNSSGNNVFQDVFVTKLNAGGSALVYSTYLGGGHDDAATGLALDPAGNAYITGLTNSQTGEFPTSANAAQKTYGGGTDDAFVMKLNASGSALLYSTYLGGSGEDDGNGIALDSAGNTYVTGVTRSTDFPVVNAFQPHFGGGVFDAFVTKLSADGSAFRYSTYLGGSNPDFGAGIAVNSSNANFTDVYVAGSTSSSNFPRTIISNTLSGGTDAFVV
ncbi:MAG: SBBP repeat-containing protein, partial [Acidobacteria bacterium]|nr:SBBP repeat-containing protein [Acidobacteriota bacterium]